MLLATRLAVLGAEILAFPLPESSLRLEAPSSCLSESEFRRRVESALHEEVSAERTLLGLIRPEPWGDFVTFRLFESGEEIGSRAFELTGDCRRGDDTLVLVAAMLLEGAAEPAPEKPSPSEAGPSPKFVAGPASVPNEEKPPEDDGLNLRLRLGLGARPGWMPGAGWFSFVGASLGLGRFSFGAVGTFYLPASVSESGGVALMAGGGEGELCWEPSPFRYVSPEVCALGGIELVGAKGEGFEENRELISPQGNLGAKVRLRGRLTQRFGWEGGLGVLIPPNRYVFTDTQGQLIYEQWPLSPLAEAGVYFEF